jgi:type I restriction enzyme S subunit
LVPPLKSQQVIADYLDRETSQIDALIDSNQRSVRLLEERWHAVLQAKLDIPGPRLPLKRIAHVNPENLPDTTRPDYRFRYIDIAATGRGVLEAEPLEMTFESAPSRAKRALRRGDTILSTVRTYLRASWTVREQAKDLVASTGFVCLRPGKDIDARFLGWLVAGDVVVDEVVARSVGVSYPAINPSAVGLIKVPCPPLREQRSIAGSLDAARQKIDALSAARVKMSQLLHERRQAVIEKAVTGRLDIPEAA